MYKSECLDHVFNIFYPTLLKLCSNEKCIAPFWVKLHHWLCCLKIFFVVNNFFIISFSKCSVGYLPIVLVPHNSVINDSWPANRPQRHKKIISCIVYTLRVVCAKCTSQHKKQKMQWLFSFSVPVTNKIWSRFIVNEIKLKLAQMPTF